MKCWNINRFGIFLSGLLAAFFMLTLSVFAEEAASDAADMLAEADSLYAKGDYAKAGEKYTAVAPFMGAKAAKVSAYQKAVESYNKGKLYYKEFEAIERLLNACPDVVDYSKYVQREYAIGESFYRGHRDPAYWALRFIPWMTSDDYTIEIYQKAIERAPFAEEAGFGKLRLAEKLLLQDKKEQINEGLEILRKIIKDHNDDPKVQKLAMLELGNALFMLASSGDGDGKYNREATKVYNDFLKDYPKEQECFGIRQKLLQLRDFRAKRLSALARFYQRSGKRDSAERYLNELVKIYPDTPLAAESEIELSRLDKSYIPEAIMPEVKSRDVTYQAFELPVEDSELITTPEESNGKWLLPIRSLNLNNQEDKK